MEVPHGCGPFGPAAQLLRKSNQQRKHSSGKGTPEGRTSVNMQDRELYRRIFGNRGPWQVERVELKRETGEVYIYLDHAADVTWSCLECGAASPLHDHQAERSWRHLDTCQYQTILHASPPRTQCAQHGVKV